ncbi:MAG: hypothetical protein LBQ79_13705, partial [Deltaproteobacteria bacterium]|nr:hypothetical protein [Deltaproteobacteria bacterium]
MRRKMRIMFTLLAILIMLPWLTLSFCRVCQAEDGGSGEGSDGGPGEGSDGGPGEGSDGGTGEGSDGHGGAEDAGPEPQSKDKYQKLLAEKHRVSLLRYFGFTTEMAEGAVPLGTELIKNTVEIRRPDCVFRFRDDSVLVLEFQSTSKYRDILRFLEYTSLLAVKFSIDARKFVPVWCVVVYSSGSPKLPQKSYPGGN